MFEYKTEVVVAPSSMEQVANEMAKHGWRLVAAAPHHFRLSGPETLGQAFSSERTIVAQTVCLWFEREAK